MPAFREFLRIWLLVSLATLLARLLLNPAPAQAEDSWNHAGLIVRDGDGRITYAWVPFREDEIDGITLLQRSGIPVVTVGFGALGGGHRPDDRLDAGHVAVIDLGVPHLFDETRHAETLEREVRFAQHLASPGFIAARLDLEASEIEQRMRDGG